MNSDLHFAQIEALKSLEQHDKGIINMICGSGKTRIMKELTTRNQISAIFAPRKNLVE